MSPVCGQRMEKKVLDALGLELRSKKVYQKTPLPVRKTKTATSNPKPDMAAPGGSGTTKATAEPVPEPPAAAMERPTKVTLPKFWPASVEVWFIQCESVFRRCRLTDTMEKFDAIVSSLPPEFTMPVLDILRNHQLYEDPYEAIKNKLVKKHTLSTWKRLDQVERLVLADKEPSTLMAEMAAYLEPATAQGVWFQWQFLKKLPTALQAALSLQECEDEEHLAAATDKWWDANGQAVIAAAATAAAATARPRRQASESPPRGRNDNRRNDSRRGSDRRQRDKTPARDRGLCWYHRVHGDAATNCRDPCTWSGNEQAAPSRN